MKKFTNIAMLLAVASCSSNPTVPDGVFSDGSFFEYSTPKTTANLTGTLTLTDCSETNLVAAAELSIASKVVGDPNARFKLSGSDLRSALQKRELEVNLYENGTLKSINTTSTDKTTTVISNIFKAVASFAGIPGLFGLAPPDPDQPPFICNSETMFALQQAMLMDRAILSYRVALFATPVDELSPGDAENYKNMIEQLASQRAILTAEKLTIAVNKKILLDDASTDTPIYFTLRELSPWFAESGEVDDEGIPERGGDPCLPVKERRNSHTYHLPDDQSQLNCKTKTPFFAMKYSVVAVDAADATKQPAASICRIGADNFHDDCGKKIVVVTPAKASITVHANSLNFEKKLVGDVLGSSALPMPQWGEVSYVPLDVGFGRSRMLKMSFDQYGKKTKFHWNSEASAENITAGFAGIAESAKNATKALDGLSKLDQLTEESKLLEIQLKLNKQRLCRFIIEAGGTECPE